MGWLEWCFDGEKTMGVKQQQQQQPENGGVLEIHDDVLQKIIQFLTLFSNCWERNHLSPATKKTSGQRRGFDLIHGSKLESLGGANVENVGSPSFFQT